MHGLNNREREVIALASNPYQEEAEKRNTIKQTWMLQSNKARGSLASLKYQNSLQVHFALVLKHT